MQVPYNGAMRYPTTRGQEAPTMSTTCEKCEHEVATHIMHDNGSDPTAWHLCDTCDYGWWGKRNRSKLVEHEPYVPELSMIARDAMARSFANDLYVAYIEYVCDADSRRRPGNFGYDPSDYSFRDFVQAGVDDGGLYDDCDRAGYDIIEDQHFLHLILHFAQVGGVRV